MPVAEVGAVAGECPGRALHDLRVERRQRQRPGAGLRAEARPAERGAGAAGDQTRFVEPAFPGGAQHLRAAAHGRERGGERTAGEDGVGADESVDAQRDVLGQLPDGEVHPEIVRYGVEAAGVHDARAGLARPGVVLQIHPVGELRLAREVGVVGARLGAGGDELLPVPDVRADGRGHHVGRLGQFAQCVRVAGIGVQQREVRAVRMPRGEAVAQLFQLGAVAAGQGPAEAVRCVRRQVLGGEHTHETGGTEEDHVIGA